MTEFRFMRSISDYDKFEEHYISWLYEKVGRDSREYGCYWRLIKRLYFHPFYVNSNRRSQTYKDVNRIMDGLDLRDQFVNDFGFNNYISSNGDSRFYEFISEDSACSMLEMLVAFALRIQSDIMWDPDNDDRTPLWFWTMLENAGVDLKAYRDEYFNENCMMELAEICSRIVNRTYTKTGMGSLFPLKNYKKDLRRVELWYQMQFWIGENYPI